jgi:hypothetical protein
MKRCLAVTLAVAFSSTSALAQESAAPQAAPVEAPIMAQPRDAVPSLALPANTEIVLSLNEELDSRRNHEHDTFALSVVGDVMLGNYVVIPAGTRAVGEITWMTGRGMFGKSGKMDIAARSIELNGRNIPIEGTFRQEGEGNTVATIASVVLIAPVVGFFITGHSAIIPAGRHLTVHTRQALAISLPVGSPVEASTIQATLASTAAPAVQAPAAGVAPPSAKSPLRSR